MKPILITTEMVKATLDGRKTQTRRVIKPQLCYGGYDAFLNDEGLFELCCDGCFEQKGHVAKCPYGKIGDKLWVKENFHIGWYDAPTHLVNGGYLIDLKTFEEPIELNEKEWNKFIKWKNKVGDKSKLFMFKSLSRITLEITDIRVERVQDITVDDIKAEGVQSMAEKLGKKKELLGVTNGHRWQFYYLWDSIYKKRGYGWSVNPWVWVIEFKRCDNENNN